MTQYDNTNRGVLFKNEEKKNPKGPDFGGSINIEGVEYFLDGWRHDAAPGKKARISLSVKKKDKQPGAMPTQQRVEKKVELDDEVPF